MMIFGSGILRGMAVTLKNFFQSYFRKPDEGGLFTVEYPEKRLPEIEHTRTFPFLVYDEDPERLRCVACEICAKECPSKCIDIEKAKTADGKPERRPAVFDVDLSLCMNCGICEEVCPFDSIFMDHTFEITSSNGREALVYHKEDLAKSNDYFRRIRPADAASVDAKRKTAEEKKKVAAEEAKAAPKNRDHQGK